MKKTYVLNWHYSVNFKKRIYEWKEQENYRTDNTVLITENGVPVEILVPELCKDMGASWYEHCRRRLDKFKWEEDIKIYE